jgi:ABC-type branched-subunit amino acid transport system ATPase component
VTGVLKPSSGRVELLGRDITGLPRETRVRRGLARTFQINQLFPTMTPLEMIALVTSERLGRGVHAFSALDRDADLVAQTAEILARFRLDDIMHRAHRDPALWQAAPDRDRSRLRRQARACCCSTSRRPACRRLSAAN